MLQEHTTHDWDFWCQAATQLVATCQQPKSARTEAGSQKRVWICMDLYGSVRMSKDLQNLGPSKKYKMLISSCVCRNYDSASC